MLFLHLILTTTLSNNTPFFYLLVLVANEKLLPAVNMKVKCEHTSNVVKFAKPRFQVTSSLLQFSSVQFSSVAQSCPTLCDPMNCSTPGLPVYHQLPEFTQTRVHRVGDAIQPSHPLTYPSPADNPYQHQSLLQHHSSKPSVLRHSAFFIVQLSHPYVTTGKTIALTRQTFVGKVMSLLFNMLSGLVIAFLPRSKRLLISWLQ